MKPTEIAQRVATIVALDDRGDHEGAHAEEDKLRQDFLQYIIDDYDGTIALKAKMIISASNDDTPRWYA